MRMYLYLNLLMYLNEPKHLQRVSSLHTCLRVFTPPAHPFNCLQILHHAPPFFFTIQRREKWVISPKEHAPAALFPPLPLRAFLASARRVSVCARNNIADEAELFRAICDRVKVELAEIITRIVLERRRGGIMGDA